MLDLPLAFALLICWLMFALVAKRQYSLRQIMQQSWHGAKTSFIVIRVLILIGALIGIWMSSGTIATLVYYSFLLANPHVFILLVFVICALVSLVIGTSFGTVSVVGLPLILVAKSGDINLAMVAGAIISGIYFGDRCSPLSSSASLVAAISFTNLFANIKGMLKNSWLALLTTLSGYGLLSYLNPLSHTSNKILDTLHTNFTIHWLLLVPVLIIVILSMFRRPISLSIVISVLVAMILGVTLQHQPLTTLLSSLITGFHPTNATLIHGGGLTSMLNPMCVVFLSCAIAGLLENLDAFIKLKAALTNPDGSISSRFVKTLVVSLFTGAIGCNQSVSIIMTRTLVKDNYANHDFDLAMDIENSSVLTSPLIPWNIAVFVPLTIIGADFASYIPFALFLYLVPLFYFIQLKFVHKNTDLVN